MTSFGDRLVGSCDVFVADVFVARRRCWLDWSAEEFAVEIGTLDQCTGTAEPSNESLSFRKLVFPSQVGDLTADTIPFAFVKYAPSSGSSSVEDTLIGRSLDQVQLTATWRFVCNTPIQLYSEQKANEVLLRPGIPTWRPVQLACGGTLIGTKYGVSVHECPDFGPPNVTALGLALGCPVQEFARQEGNDICLVLNHWHQSGKPVPFFDASNNGHSDLEQKWDSIAEVYRAALDFQNNQADSGSSFRLAVVAFAEARSLPVGYTLKMLAAMHFLEWLDGETRMDWRVLVREFNLSEPVARAIMILRNEISHNHVDTQVAVDRACVKFRAAGIDLAGYGPGGESVGLYNYLYSLTGKLLLERIGADVSPVRHLPGYGEFGG